MSLKMHFKQQWKRIVNTICHIQSISENRDTARKGGVLKNKWKNRITFFYMRFYFWKSRL